MCLDEIVIESVLDPFAPLLSIPGNIVGFCSEIREVRFILLSTVIVVTGPKANIAPYENQIAPQAIYVEVAFCAIPKSKHSHQFMSCPLILKR